MHTHHQQSSSKSAQSYPYYLPDTIGLLSAYLWRNRTVRTEAALVGSRINFVSGITSKRTAFTTKRSRRAEAPKAHGQGPASQPRTATSDTEPATTVTARRPPATGAKSATGFRQTGEREYTRSRTFATAQEAAHAASQDQMLAELDRRLKELEAAVSILVESAAARLAPPSEGHAASGELDNRRHKGKE